MCGIFCFPYVSICANIHPHLPDGHNMLYNSAGCGILMAQPVNLFYEGVLLMGEEKKARKRPRKDSPKEILEKYAEYLELCDEAERRPTWEGFAEFVGISSAALLDSLNFKDEEGKAEKSEMAEALQKIQDSIVNRLMQRNDAMATFLIKQPRYGGYNDKPATPGGNEPVKVEFHIRGVGEESGLE
jgi:hypothetical protein